MTGEFDPIYFRNLTELAASGTPVDWLELYEDGDNIIGPVRQKPDAQEFSFNDDDFTPEELRAIRDDYGW